MQITFLLLHFLVVVNSQRYFFSLFTLYQIYEVCPTKAHSPPSRTSRAIRQSNISTVTCLPAQPCHGQQALSCPKTPKTRIFHKSPSASHDCRSHASIACLFKVCSLFTPSEKTNHQSCAQPKIIEFLILEKMRILFTV